MGDCTDPASLQQRFFEAVGSYRKVPPERALLRILLDCALQNAKFLVSGRTIKADKLDHVALRLYLRADVDGVVEGFRIETLAADAKLDKETYRLALIALGRLHVLRSNRPSRRKPERHQLMVGDLDWPTACERAKLCASDRTQRTLSDRTSKSLSDRTVRSPKGYTEGHQKRTSEGENLSRGTSTNGSLGTPREPPAGDFGVEGMYWEDEGEG